MMWSLAFILSLAILEASRPSKAPSSLFQRSDESYSADSEAFEASKKKAKDRAKAEELVTKGYDVEGEARIKLFRQALKLHPRNGNALVQLGMAEMHLEDPVLKERAFKRIGMAFSPKAEPPVPLESFQGQFLAARVGRFFADKHHFKKARRFLEMAAGSKATPDDCQAIQASLLVSGYPESIAAARAEMERYHRFLDHLLSFDKLDVSKTADNDPYFFCILTAFYHEIYYESDFRENARKHYEVRAKAFPQVLYTVKKPFWQFLWGESKRKPSSHYRIGVASGSFSPKDSVYSDFGGMLERLPRGEFNMFFIYFREGGQPPVPHLGVGNDTLLVFEKNTQKDWLKSAWKQIVDLELDLLLYLDATMSAMCGTAAMSKLARVQALSHGHPVTSGIPRDVMNYYVSWAAAELPLEESQEHYTEELMLLPANTMHHYYNHRSTPEGRSVIDGQLYKHLTRDDFPEIPEDGHWYTCMQKPFKRHPEFDFMLADIIKKDPKAQLLLHGCENPANEEIMKARLKNAGVPMDHVHFIIAQPHHRLMALYRLSDVILDSYMAGGCTTTREALEIGSIIVTLPAKYLGGRWSLAYYSIMGVLDVVAKDKEDYVKLALRMGTDKKARAEVQGKILKNVHKLYFKTEAVDAWTNIIKRMIAKGPHDEL